MSLFAPLVAPASLSSVSALSPFTNPNGLDTADAADPNDPAAPSFGQTLQSALSHVNDLQNKSGDLTKAYATGQTSDIHGVMIAGEQATIALQLTTQIRNKAIDAYQEIMRISM